MGEGLSFEPGANTYHDLIFIVILIIGTIISYWSMFYGLVYIFQADKKRQQNKEKYIGKMIIKLIVLLYPIAIFIGFPLFINLATASYVFFGGIITIFDSTIDVSLLEYFLFIALYGGYVFVFFKRINRLIDKNLVNAMIFFNDWYVLPDIGSEFREEGSSKALENSNVWTVRIYKGAIHLSIVPAILFFIINVCVN